jgi:hypothetical protein
MTQLFRTDSIKLQLSEQPGGFFFQRDTPCPTVAPHLPDFAHISSHIDPPAWSIPRPRLPHRGISSIPATASHPID